MAEDPKQEQVIKRIKEYVLDYLKREKPYLLLMDEEILGFLDKHQNGTVNFSVRIYQGKAEDMIVEVLPHSENIKYVFKK